MKDKAKWFSLLTTMVVFTWSANGQVGAGEGFSKTFGVVQHEGSPYPFIVTDEVHAGYDFDGDGKMEFFVLADHSNPNSGSQWEQITGHSVWLYEATAVGTYELVWSWIDTTLRTGGASFPAATVGDLDGDGNPELLLGMPYGTGWPDNTTSPARFYVWEADASGLPSDGEPTAIWDFGVSPGTNTRPSAIAAGDIDGDGAQEVALGFRAFSDATANDAMMIFSLDGAFAGDFTQWTVELLDTTSDVGSTYSAAITDVDNDGNKEAFFSTDYGSWFEASGPDSYDEYPELLAPGTTFWTIQGVANVDIDGDGVSELVIGKTSGELFLVGGVSDLASADSMDLVRIMALSPGGTRGLAAGDFDGDAYGDIFMGGNYASDVWMASYGGSGSITDSSSYTVQLVYTADTTGSVRTYSLSFGGDQEAPGADPDLDGNDLPDLVIGFEDGDSTATEYVVVVEKTGVVAIEKDFGAPILNTYKLTQNYPNPFNPTTTIDFVITAGGEVQLTVFDILGRKVKTLVSEHQGPGEFSVDWDGTDNNGQLVASGLYLYRLNVNGVSLTRRMTFVR